MRCVHRFCPAGVAIGTEIKSLEGKLSGLQAQLADMSSDGVATKQLEAERDAVLASLQTKRAEKAVVDATIARAGAQKDALEPTNTTSGGEISKNKDESTSKSSTAAKVYVVSAVVVFLVVVVAAVVVRLNRRANAGLSAPASHRTAFDNPVYDSGAPAHTPVQTAVRNPLYDDGGNLHVDAVAT